MERAASHVEVMTIMQGEAFAIRWACLMAYAFNLSHLEIAGDNKVVISLCVSKNDPPCDYAPIIEDIILLARFRSFSRSANREAHWTANAFLSGSLPVH